MTEDVIHTHVNVGHVTGCPACAQVADALPENGDTDDTAQDSD